MSTLLDPRFKGLHAIPLEARARAHVILRKSMQQEKKVGARNNTEETHAEEEKTAPPAGSPLKRKFYRFNTPDPVALRSDVQSSEETDIDREILEYEAEPALEDAAGDPDMAQDPLAWWRARAGKYPIMSRLARKFLGIRASSAAVEHMFSNTGNRVSKKHARLCDEALLAMMLTRTLYRFVEQYGQRYLPSL
jgi:hypothetical protein